MSESYATPKHQCFYQIAFTILLRRRCLSERLLGRFTVVVLPRSGLFRVSTMIVVAAVVVSRSGFSEDSG